LTVINDRGGYLAVINGRSGYEPMGAVIERLHGGCDRYKPYVEKHVTTYSGQ
jgi:hypothetical protein